MQHDIVAKLQAGNWTDADVSEAVAEIVRLREEVKRLGAIVAKSLDRDFREALDEQFYRFK